MSDNNNNGTRTHNQAGVNVQGIDTDITPPGESPPLDPGAEDLKGKFPPDNFLKKQKSAGGIKFTFLGGLEISDNGIFTIGARSGGGKTTFLINCTRELLHAGKKVIYVSYEQDIQQLCVMIALSMLGESGAEKPFANIDELSDQSGTGLEVSLVPAIVRGINQTGQAPPPLQEQAEQVKQYLQSEKLIGYYRPGETVDALRLICQKHDPAVIIVDYVQRIPGAGEGYGRFIPITAELIDIAQSRLVILGAQFNRNQGAERNTHRQYIPTDKVIREADEILQCSENFIGLGWDKAEDGTRDYYYYILKSRFSGSNTGKRIPAAGNYPLSYSAPCTKPWTADFPLIKESQEKKGKQKKSNPMITGGKNGKE